MAQDQQTFSRGTWTSFLGLGIQLFLAIAALLASFWIDNTGWQPGAVILYALTWYLFAAGPVWALVGIIFNEHRRERVEALEAEQLARADQKARIFDEAGEDLALSKRRLALLYKWAVPVVTVGVAVFMFAVGVVLLLKSLAPFKSDAALKPMPATVNLAVLMALSAGIAFVAFTVARYNAGMTKVREWTLLRGGAGHLMGAGLVAGLLLAASVLANFESHRFFYILAVIAPAIMIALSIEMVFSLLLGVYRPRKPGEVPKLPFDSRLLGWLISPESFSKIIGETLNYQFGWEVSRSWFYQLLSRSVTWLIVFGAGSLLLVSCIVVVGPQEQAIITTFGKVRGDDASAVKGPGLYLKWPWPISDKYTFPAGRVVEFSIGSVRDKIRPEQSILWTTKHGEEEYMLVASPSLAGESATQGAPAASATGMALVGCEVVVQYRIGNLLKYFRSAAKPHDALVAIADRHLNAYFAAHDIDTLLAQGRLELGPELQKRVQDDATAMGLGVNILFVGVKGVHPPQDQVAEAFLEQIGALQERESQIEKAKQEATGVYAEVAGSRESALRIAERMKEFNAINQRIEDLRGKPPVDAAALSAAQTERRAKELQIVGMIADAPGKAAEAIYVARAQRWERVNAERGQALKFLAELATYNNAKRYYATRLYLNVLVAAMSNPRKYVVTTQQSAPLMIEIDLTDENTVLPGILSGKNK